MTNVEKIFLAACALFIAVACIGIYSQYQDCSDRGGILLRGLIGYECIDLQSGKAAK